MQLGVGAKAGNQTKRKKAFLEALEKGMSIGVAAKATRVDPKTIYSWRVADPEFEQAVLAARDHAVEVLEASAYRRALNEEGKYDERTAAILTMFLIKGQRPVYKDSFKAEIDVGTVKFSFVIPKPEGLGEVPQLPAGPVVEGEFREDDGGGT